MALDWRVMASKVVAGDEVQTPLGKGIVREVRGHGWILIEINGRALVLEERTLGPIDVRSKTRAARKPSPVPQPSSRSSAPRDDRASAAIDLHGLTVEEALARIETAVNEALLADVPELRLIHGHGSGRIRAALHRSPKHGGHDRAILRP